MFENPFGNFFLFTFLPFSFSFSFFFLGFSMPYFISFTTAIYIGCFC